MQLHLYKQAEQVKALYERMPTVLYGTAAVSILTVALLWKEFEHSSLLTWLGAALSVVALRWLSYSKYKQAHPTAIENEHIWLRKFVFWAFITGSMWGILTLFFISADKPTNTLFITCVFAGYMAAASSSTGLYAPAYFALSLPAAGLFILKNAILGGSMHNAISIMIVLYLVVMISFARYTQSLFDKNVQLNFEKNSLLDELRIEKETAELAVQAKNQFFAAASHDLRQPLHALNLFVDALKPLQKDKEGQVIVEKIGDSTAALSGLMHGMLDISRLDASAVASNPINIPLSHITDLLLSEYLPQISRSELSLNCEVDSNMVVFIDPLLLERVLRNLLDNAVKYTEAGTVSISASIVDDEVHVAVADTGKGIPQSEIKNVFSEFHQLNNPERDRNKGLGLGLAIVKRLTEVMDIELSLESEVNLGTMMKLILPLGDATQLAPTTPLQKALLTGLNIVVIDDERDILDGMFRILSNWGCKPHIALTGSEAIHQLMDKDIVPDVIVSDFRLPNNENGIEVIERIREEFNQAIPAILVTGDTAPDRVNEAKSADVTVLYKPIKPDELKTSIQKLLS